MATLPLNDPLPSEDLLLTENTTCSIKFLNAVGPFIWRDEQFYKKNSMETASEIQFAVRSCGLSAPVKPCPHLTQIFYI